MKNFPIKRKALYPILFILFLFLFSWIFYKFLYKDYNELITLSTSTDISTNERFIAAKKALKIAIQKENLDHQLETQFIISHLYFDQELYDSAFLSFQKGEILSQTLIKPDLEFDALYFMGLSKEYQYQFESAATYYKKALILIENYTNEERKSQALEALGILYITKKDLDSAQNYFKRALEIDKKRADSLDIANSLNNLGLISQWTGDYTNSLNHLKQAQEIYASKDPENYAITSLNIGIVFKRLADYSEAIRFGLEAMETFEGLNLKKEMASAYNLLGNSFAELNEIKKSKDYHLKALEIRKEISDSSGLGSTYTNLGNLQVKDNDNLEAINFYERSLNIQTNLGDHTQIALNLNNIGLSYLNLKKFHEAEKSFIQSITLKRKTGDKKGLGMTYNHLGKLYDQKNNLSKMKLSLDSALYYILQTGSKDLLIENYVQLISYHTKKKNLKRALNFHENLLLLKDSIFNADNQRFIAEAQAKYETEKALRISTQLELENQSKTANIKLQSSFLIALSVGSFLSFIAILLIYKNYKIRRSSESRLKHLYQELHHRVSNSLQNLVNLLRIQANSFNDGETRSVLKENETRVEAINLIHQQMYKHEEPTDIELEDYLQSLIENLLFSFSLSGSSVKVSYKVEPIKVSTDKAIPIGLIVNELVINSLKHAFNQTENRSLFISAQENDNNLLLLNIWDNGVGIKHHQKGKDSKISYGNQLIQTLIKQLNGNQKLLDNPGTCWQIELNIH